MKPNIPAHIPKWLGGLNWMFSVSFLFFLTSFHSGQMKVDSSSVSLQKKIIVQHEEAQSEKGPKFFEELSKEIVSESSKIHCTLLAPHSQDKNSLPLKFCILFSLKSG